MALTRVRVPECPEDADESWFEGIFAKAGRRVRAVSPSHLPTTNFASIIRTYRVAFEDESEEDGASSIQCLVKFTPPDPDTRNLLCGIYRFFGRELEVYEKLLPDMESFLKGKGMTLDLFPRFYGGGERAEDAKGYVVLEDLGPLGYRALKNVKDLDEPHAFLALHALARLHAFSYAFLQSHPVHRYPLVEKYGFPERECGPWIRGCVESAERLLLSTFGSTCPARLHLHGFLSGDGEPFKVYREPMIPSGTLDVIVHGDFYFPNILYSYADDGDGGKIPNSCKIVDLQLLSCCHPAVDLAFFAFIDIPTTLRRRILTGLLATHYKTFCEILRDLGVDLTEDLGEYVERFVKTAETYGAMHACFALPVLYADPEIMNDHEPGTSFLRHIEAMKAKVHEGKGHPVAHVLRDVILDILNLRQSIDEETVRREVQKL